MDNLKEAFSKVKQDIESLNNKIEFLSKDISKTKKELFDICEILKEFNLVNKKISDQNWLLQEQNHFLASSIQDLPRVIKEAFASMNPAHNSAYQQINSAVTTDNPAHNCSFKAQNANILGISKGNEGVPADRQTNQQTNQQTDFICKKDFLEDFNVSSKIEQSSHNIKNNSINEAANILDSLDNLKKEIRLKFKRLTDQELTVFSAIYQLDEENGSSDYKLLSKRLNLTESSIRDYIGRLIKKGIPIEKIKINNKQIQLNISNNLKKIATLNTILQLREL